MTEPRADKVALLTGATGFIGKHLARRLVREGWQVHALTRPVSSWPVYPEFTQVMRHDHEGGGVGLTAIVAKVKPAVVFHLASLFLAEHRPEDVTRLIDSNLTFASELLEAMKENGVRHFVNTGTVWQHYRGDAYEPVNLYAATKQAFEDILDYYVSAHGFRAITLKLADTYGPDDTRPKLLNLLRRCATENQPLELSPGEQKIDLVHVEDVVAAFLLAAARVQAAECAGHERYAVTTGNPLSLRQLVALCEDAWGRALPVKFGARPYRAREVMLPWQGKTLPGWQPQRELFDHLQEWGKHGN